MRRPVTAATIRKLILQPGVMMYLCFWYKPDERATRMAIFAASIAVAGYAT
jgi:hypothetical protein